jgi:hypothetical protein
MQPLLRGSLDATIPRMNRIGRTYMQTIIHWRWTA